MWVGLESCRGIDIRALERLVEAGVAKLGQRRWDEVPVSMSSQVRILPSASFLFLYTLHAIVGYAYRDGGY